MNPQQNLFAQYQPTQVPLQFNGPQIQPLQLQENEKLKKQRMKADFNIEFHEALKELENCEEARIGGNSFSCKAFFNALTGCQLQETFRVYLKDENEEKLVIKCEENSECWQRTCVKKMNRQFLMNAYFIEDGVENKIINKHPFMRVERINGGCCPDRAIINIIDGNGNRIGSVKEEPVDGGQIASIYNKGNVKILEIRVKSRKRRINKTDAQNCCYIWLCCGCCGLCMKEEQLNFDIVRDNTFSILKDGESVGEIGFPCKIYFTNISDPYEKFMVIMSRIFMVYFLDKSDTFIEKAYDAGKGNTKDCLRCCCICGCI